MRKREFIFNKLRETSGSEQSTKLTLCTDVATGETTAIVSHEISQRFPVTEVNTAEDLFERLTCGSGRRAYKPQDLAHPYNPTS